MEPASYEVVRQIGEGGIGRVYEAIHQPSGRAVAIKTLRTEHGASSSQRLLLNEAAAAAQLAHPSIVELLDVGRDDRGAMFLVMELVRGSSLESWANAFPGLRTALRAFDEILGALATAHAQGIVHGDLKPGNVLLTADGRVKLTDFGIAHVIDPLRAAERRGVQGTPYYMAPEQLVDVGAIGPSTDLYAIGVMLYELLAGREPYGSEGTLAEMLGRKLAPIPPLAPRAGVAVPPALAAFVMELLDPNPRTRPRFAARVRAVLAEHARHASDDRALAPASIRDAATWIDSSVGTDPTIHSSGELPPSGGSTRSLPFSLPCAVGAEPTVALHRLRPLPMIGRDAQTRRLMAEVAEVAAVGGARGVLVSGRAGEGKTRLVRHAFAEVERMGTMLGVAASFDETITSAQVGLRACMTRLLGASNGSLEETLAGPWRWLGRVPQPGVDFGRIHDWLVPHARPLEAVAAAGVAASCVLAASRIFPVLLWLDDVAWSRDGAMELFLRLLQRDDGRVLVVGTLRSGTAEHPAVRAWLLEVAAAGARLEMLPPLDARQRAALVAAAGPVVPEAAESIAGELDEPALVLVETVRGWIDEGELALSERGYVFRQGANASDLARRTPKAVVARRIDKLLDGFGDRRDDAERVLSHAALLGLRFEERVLRACADVAPWVDRVLDRALLSGLLRVDGRHAYRFDHRIFVDVIVERLARRADANAIRIATADALVAVYGRSSTDVGWMIATLYRAGGDHEAAARQAKQAIRTLARVAFFDAADRELAQLAEWVAAEGVPDDHIERGLLESARGGRAYFALDYPTARAHFGRALQVFRRHGSVADIHHTVFDLSSTYFYEDRFGEAEHHVRFVETEAVVDPIAHSRGYHRLAELAAMRGDLATAMVQERRALELAEGREVLAEFVARLTLTELALAAGQVGDGTAHVEAAEEMARRIGDRELMADVEHAHAMVDVARGYFAAARAREEPRFERLIARGDKWQATSSRALLLLCAAGLRDPPAQLERMTRELVASYVEVPHDEPFTWWAMRSAATQLRAAGHPALATELSAALDARLERIARAFDTTPKSA